MRCKISQYFEEKNEQNSQNQSAKDNCVIKKPFDCVQMKSHILLNLQKLYRVSETSKLPLLINIKCIILGSMLD